MCASENLNWGDAGFLRQGKNDAKPAALRTSMAIE